MKTKYVLLWAIVLFAIDQTIKIVIDRYFLDVRFDIISPLFYFKPTFNHQYSWINGLFGLGMGFWAHIVIFCVIAVLVAFFYDWMKSISGNNKMLNIAFVFCFAGMISSLIGTIFWNGCLDYIYLKPLFVFDLKDLFIDTFIILLLLYLHKNNKHLSSIKNKDLICHFKNRFSSIINQKSKMENGTQ